MGEHVLFAGKRYYPNGGMDDYIGSFPTLEEAVAAGKEACTGEEYIANDWWHVSKDNKIVVSGVWTWEENS